MGRIRESDIVYGMELVLPSSEYEDSFIEAVKEFQRDDEFPRQKGWYAELSLEELEKDFTTYVKGQLAQARGENLPEGYVPQSNYWLVDDGEFIGAVRIRQRLNEHLMEIGGHIGYAIRPSMRGRGYGNQILELALRKAKEMGIERVRITCDVDNIPSRKIIEKNGGMLDSEIPNPETGVSKARFWIHNT